MVKSNKVQKGSKISKAFDGAQYEEQSITRKAIYAIIVINNPDDYSQEEVAEANENIVKFEEYNKKVNDLLIP